MTWNVNFYEKPSGKNPIEEFLDDLPHKTKAKIISYIAAFQQHGFQLPKNYLEKIDDNLWALRPEYDGNEYRLFFSRTKKETVFITHAIQKKTPKLASNDLKIARQRRDELTAKK